MSSSDPSKGSSKESAPVVAGPVTGGGAPAGDPSMEDILASIRRILNEDETSVPAQPPHEDVSTDDVLMLEPSMMLPDPATGSNNDLIDPPAEVPADASVMTVAPAQVQPSPPDRPDRAGPALGAPSHAEPILADLVAPAAAAAAASSVGALVRSIVAERSMQVYSGGPTIEDIVRAELRPLLKQWLDEHLPPMVERLVRAELERVIGRAIP